MNLKVLMEMGKITLRKSNKTYQSLTSVQYEQTDGRVKIYGRDTHVAEALIRAAWCMRDKALNIWLYNIK